MNKNIDENKFNEDLLLIDEFWLGVSSEFICGLFSFGVDENKNE